MDEERRRGLPGASSHLPRYTGSGMKVQAATPPGAKRVFTTISGVPVGPLYGPEQIQEIDPAPGAGEFPYTRGIRNPDNQVFAAGTLFWLLF